MVRVISTVPLRGRWVHHPRRGMEAEEVWMWRVVWGEFDQSRWTVGRAVLCLGVAQ